MEKPKVTFFKIDHKANEKGFLSPPHSHQHYELFFFEKGQASHHIDFEEHPVVDNSIFLVSYNQVHYIEAEPFSHNIGSVLSFDKPYFDLLDYDFRDLFGAFARQSSYYLDAETGTVVNWNLNQIKREMAEKQPKSEAVIHCYIKLILVILFRAKSAYSGTNSSSRTIALRLLSELEIHFRQKKTAGAYADLLAVSPKHLNRICKAEFGTNVLRLIHERVNLEARRLLVYTEHSVKEIGFIIGFEDQAHFSNFFKRMNKESPANFRKTMAGIYK